MSVIFQLYRAEDLQNLGAQLEDFKREVGRIMNTTPVVLEHARDRANTVFAQLTPQANPQPSLPPNDVLSQLFTPAQIERLDDQQRDILRMAISCHLAHIDEAIEAIRTEADQVFRRLTNGMNPQGADIPYTHF
jgi:hypothetical protein